MSLTVSVQLTAPKPSRIYDLYWYFASERQKIFFRRLRGEPFPWTTDPILSTYRFTNAYRASDRVSQYLIKQVIATRNLPPAETFFRILIFKVFNTVHTWELLEERLGEVCWAEYTFSQYDGIMSGALSAGRRIFSSAYIMPTGSVFAHKYKHQNFFNVIELMMKDSLPEMIQNAGSFEEVVDMLQRYPLIGRFLSYQFATDLNYSELINFSECDYVLPGPGAVDGIAKCFTDLGDYNESDIIRWVADHQEIEFARLGLNFVNLWGRPLQLIDCQNLFCEISKYTRVSHPGIVGTTGRSRIKQVYHSTAALDYPRYPPKWGLNGLISKGLPNACV